MVKEDRKMRTLEIFGAAAAVLSLLACAKEPIAPEKNLVRVSISAADVRAQMNGCNSTSTLFEAGDQIKVNGKICSIQFDKDGKPFIEVEAADKYEACYPSYLCSSSSGSIDLCKLQTAQFAYYDDASQITGIGRFNPLWAAPSTTPELTFQPVCGILKITVKGENTVKIGSIKVENKAGDALENALSGDFTCTSGVLVPKKGAEIHQNYVVLNCGKGVALSPEGTDFYICLPQGTYSAGLKLTICDSSNKSMIIDSNTSRTITAGKILETPAITYAPAANLIFSEYFDVFVWGSDYMGGRKTYTNVALSNYPKWDAPATVTRNPATDFSNEINFNTKYASKPEYVSNMNGFSSTQNRIQNVYICPGYLACGNGATRTVLDTKTLGHAGKIVICLDFARNLTDTPQGAITFQSKTAGTISSAIINGVTYTATDTAAGVKFDTKNLTLSNDKFCGPGWNHVEIHVTGATTSTAFTTFQDNLNPVARFYIDNIVITSE